MNDLRVTVNGDQYQIVDTRSTSGLGSKFYGKFSFTLRRVSDGAKFTAYGKRVSHNSRLTPVAPAPAPHECGSCGVPLIPGTAGNVAACDFHDQTCDRCDRDLHHPHGRSA